MRHVNSFRIVWLSVAIVVASACGSQGDSSPSGATAPRERVGSSSAALGTCASGALTASLTTPQSPGPTITLTAASGTCTAPLYQFWEIDVSGPYTWTMIQDFSTNSTFTWDTSSATDGTYYFQVLIKDTTSNATYDTVGDLGDFQVRIDLSVDRNFPYLQVYTGDGLEKGRRRTSVAIEPMTCPPDALRSGKDLVILEPGQHWAGSWRLRRR